MPRPRVDDHSATGPGSNLGVRPGMATPDGRKGKRAGQAWPRAAAALHSLAQVITTTVSGWPGVTHWAVRGGVICGACWIGVFGLEQYALISASLAPQDIRVGLLCMRNQIARGLAGQDGAALAGGPS